MLRNGRNDIGAAKCKTREPPRSPTPSVGKQHVASPRGNDKRTYSRRRRDESITRRVVRVHDVWSHGPGHASQRWHREEISRLSEPVRRKQVHCRVLATAFAQRRYVNLVAAMLERSRPTP